MRVRGDGVADDSETVLTPTPSAGVAGQASTTSVTSQAQTSGIHDYDKRAVQASVTSLAGATNTTSETSPAAVAAGATYASVADSGIARGKTFYTPTGPTCPQAK